MAELLHDHFWACWWLIIILGGLALMVLNDVLIAIAKSVRKGDNR